VREFDRALSSTFDVISIFNLQQYAYGSQQAETYTTPLFPENDLMLAPSATPNGERVPNSLFAGNPKIGISARLALIPDVLLPIDNFTQPVAARYSCTRKTVKRVVTHVHFVVYFAPTHNPFCVRGGTRKIKPIPQHKRAAGFSAATTIRATWP
jgi:hypothetical protein